MGSDAATTSPDGNRSPADQDLVSISCSPPAASFGSSNPKSGKKIGTRENGSSLLNSVNRSASQIRKNSLRKSGSPVTWYPRKKADSFLQRKIKHLQEVGGMNLTLDETLCGANLHYSRIAKEKIAATQAANRAMEARRAAMVEASWCRMLKAARIQNKEAEEELYKAEKHLSEAIEAAVALGVMMYDQPDSQRWPYEVQTSLGKGGRSTHTITASFETAFEVDKEVAATVKKALLRLGSCQSSNTDGFKDLLHRICENPDEENKQSISDVDTMFDRLKRLHEDELSSLATIVATCGLNAALLKNGKGKDQDSEFGSNGLFDFSVNSDRHMPSMVFKNRRYSIQGLMLGCLRRDRAEAHTVGLDKYLVKHLSKLEREVNEARNAKKSNLDMGADNALDASVVQTSESRSTHVKNALSESIPGLDSILVKHVSSLEKDVQTAKNIEKGKSKLVIPSDCIQRSTVSNNETIIDESEVVAGNCSGEIEQEKPAVLENETGHLDGAPIEDNVKARHRKELDKENINLNLNCTRYNSTTVPLRNLDGKTHESSRPLSDARHISKLERAKKEVLESFSVQDEEQLGLDKILVKPIHRLDRMKKQLQDKGGCDLIPKIELKKREAVVMPQESLDKVLVKHVSKLEKEKLEAQLQAKNGSTKPERRACEFQKNEGSLESILVKRPSRFEMSKLATVVQPEVNFKCGSTWREARERELQDAWGGLSLGNSLKPTLSRLEREKAAWRKAEEDEKKQSVEI